MGKSVPIINQWYQDIAVKRLFEVIAVDEYSALIDIRYETNSLDNNSLDNNSLDNNNLDNNRLYNNDLNSISFDDWSKMTIVTARAPEDWRSSFAKSQSPYTSKNSATPSSSSTSRTTSSPTSSRRPWQGVSRYQFGLILYLL